MDGKSYIDQIYTGNTDRGRGKNGDNKWKHRQKDECGLISTLIYRNLLLSTTQYYRKRNATLLSNKIKLKTYSVCIFLYIFTHAQTNRGEEVQDGVRLGLCRWLWAITRNTIWVTYSGEKASYAYGRYKTTFSWWRCLINRAVTCIQ